MTDRHYFVCLLRGINVGGNNKVPMKELKECFLGAGFSDVTTYIQSGNVIFSSQQTNIEELTEIAEKCIKASFKLSVPVVIVSYENLARVITSAPRNWGKDDTMKHNLLFIRRPYSAEQALLQMGTPKPEIEQVSAGEGVVYWSASLNDFSKTASSRLASKPIYQYVTVRNYNTSHKLLKLMDELARV